MNVWQILVGLVVCAAAALAFLQIVARAIDNVEIGVRKREARREQEIECRLRAQKAAEAAEYVAVAV